MKDTHETGQGSHSGRLESTTQPRQSSNVAPPLPHKPSTPPKSAGNLLKKRPTGTAPVPKRRVSGALESDFDLDATPEMPAPTAPLTQAPSEISPRQSLFGGKSPRASSPNVNGPKLGAKTSLSSLSKPNPMGNRSSKSTLDENVASERVVAAPRPKTIHPLERIKRREDAQVESLKRLGSKEHTFYRALAEIRSAFKHYHEESERMTALKALLPDPKKKMDSPHTTSDHSDDVESPQKRSSGENHSASADQTVSTTSSSPDQEKTHPDIPAETMPVSSSSSLNNSPEHPLKQPELKNSNIPIAAVNLEARVIDSGPAQKNPLCLAPVHFLFKQSEIDNIRDENDLANKPELLLPLTLVISTLRQLQGKFFGTDLLYKPLTLLCDYFGDSHNALLAAKTPAQRAEILRETACLTIFTGNKASFIEMEAAPARGMLCIDRDGNEIRKNKEGNRAVAMVQDNVMKPNHKGIFIKPGTENAVQSLYTLTPQDEDKPTGTTSTLLVVSGVPINKHYNQEQVGEKVDFINGCPTVRNTVQCGKRAYGMSLLSALRGLGLFGHWKKAIKEHELVGHLKTLETLYRNNPEALQNINHWPRPLLQHSGRLGYEIALMSAEIKEDIFYIQLDDNQLQYALKGGMGLTKASITAEECPLIRQLKKPFTLEQIQPHLLEIFTITTARGHTRAPYTECPENFKALLNLPNYNPETAITEMPQVLFRLNFRNFLAGFKANLINDPTDLTPGNIFLCWNEGDKEFYLTCIDGDEAFEFPVTTNSGIHRINSKNIYFMFPHLLDHPISEQDLDEELEYSALEWELFFCSSINAKHQGWQERIAEEVLTDADRFVPQNQRKQGEDVPTHQTSRPQRADVETKPMMLDIPLMFHHERHPMQLQTRQNMASAQRKARDGKTTLTPRLLARQAKPATALFYETLCLPHVTPDDNYAESILLGFKVITSRTPSFEEIFLDFERDILPALREHMPKKVHGPGYEAVKDYQRLAKEKGLPSLDDLSKKVTFELLDGLSLYDLLAEHRHVPNDHTNPEALRSIPKGIATFVETLKGSSIPTDTDEILRVLEILGEHLSNIDFKCRWLPENNRAGLIHEAIARALPGALKFLLKGYPNLALKVEGETPLHALMREHRRSASKKVFETLKICLNSPTCDAELEDAQHRTPLMTFIDAMDHSDPDYLTQVIRLFKQRNINLNQRTTFKPKSKKNANMLRTALDFAIDSNNVSAFIALIHEGGTDLVDIDAALKFVNAHKGNEKFDQAVELLKIQHPPFAYEMAIEAISTTEPDPAECKIIGSRHRVRYLLKSVWDTLFDKRGNINKANSVSDGQHHVIPLSLPNGDKPLLYSKFYPESPGLQRLVEIIFEYLGCATICSELWRVNSANGKEAFPILLSTASEGESLYTVLQDKDKAAELHAELDMDHFTLLSAVMALVAQEDGHPKQYKVVRMPMNPPGKRLRIVPIDFDRCFVSSFLENELLLKEILFLLPEFYNSPYTAQSIATLICANGKRLPMNELTAERAELLIRENAGKFFDRLMDEALVLEDQHLKLFPRNDPLSMACTETAKEKAEKEQNPKHRAASHFGDMLNKIDTPQIQEENKKKDDKDKKKAQSSLVNFAVSAKGVLGLNTKKTTLGCPVEKRIPTVLHERYIQMARVLRLKSGAPITGRVSLRLIRPEVEPVYHGIVTARPNDNPCQHYETLIRRYTSIKLEKGAVPRSHLTQSDVIGIVSQGLTTKHRGQHGCEDFHAAVVYYKASKRRETEKAYAVHEIQKGDTTALQGCKSEQDKEAYVKSLRWVKGGPDNKAVLETIITEEIHFEHLRLKGCQELSYMPVWKILRVSSGLATLDLRDCGGVDNYLFRILPDYNPMLRTLIISGTEISSIELDCTRFPLLETVVARGCGRLKEVKIINSTLKTLDLGGSTQVKALAYEYTEKEALRRPLQEERPLEYLNIRGCVNIPADDITRVLECSPSLTQFLHQGNQPFKARSFAWFAQQQNRFNAGTFFALVQNGVLDLWGLPFEDKDLWQFREWLCRADAPKITEFVVRSPCYFTRVGIFDFIASVPSIIKVIYQGPFLGRRGFGLNDWNIGLSHPIARILSLSDGAIIAFTHRVMAKGVKKGAVFYNLRMPDDKSKYLSGAEAHRKDEAKWTRTPYALPEGADLKDVAEMADGTLLLSLQEDSSIPQASSYLLTLDRVTHARCALDVPEVDVLGGSLCVINDKTFALQSDQLHVIQKTDIGWRVRHTLNGADVGHAPVSNGHDLLAYCWDDAKHRHLSIVDIHTGECILQMRLPDKTNKLLRFIDAERLVYFDGDYYSVLNVNTLQRRALKPYKHPRWAGDPEENCQITVPGFAWVTVLPNRQLLLGGGQHCETLDFDSLNRVTHSTLGEYATGNYLINYLGDGILLDQEKGCLAQERQFYFTIDLRYRVAHQKGYSCSVDPNHPNRLIISTPSKIDINKKLDIDGESSESRGGCTWKDQMALGEPTSTTFYDLIFAFFENCDVSHKDEGQKPLVTFEDQTIYIDGLSPEEMQQVPNLIAKLLQLQPSMASTHRSQAFVGQSRQPSCIPIAMTGPATLQREELVDDEEAIEQLRK